MRNLECQNCHNSFPAATTFLVNGEALCEPCADQRVVSIQENKGALEVTRGVDPTSTREELKGFNIWAIASLPLIVILYPLNFLRIVWADLGYGIAIGVLAPLAIFKILA